MLLMPFGSGSGMICGFFGACLKLNSNKDARQKNTSFFIFEIYSSSINLEENIDS